MELYTLDALLRRASVIDKYESLVWAERYASLGDFELSIISNVQNRSLLTAGTLLTMNESKRVMRVETLEDKEDESGKKTLVVKGTELTKVLSDRIARSATNGSTTNKWTYTGTPAATLRMLFNGACRSGSAFTASHVLPFLVAGSLYPTPNIPEPTTVYSVDREKTDLYTTIKELSEFWDLGFRMYRGPDDQTLYFDIYTGNDRTSAQTLLPPVIFSPSLDSLQNVTQLMSIAKYKNAAYVVGRDLAVSVTNDEGATATGFNLQVITVPAYDVEGIDATATAILTQRGEEALAQSRSLSAFDGEVSQLSPYKYGIDYDLGDLVEMRTDDGVTNQMRVTEQIFVSDAQGDRSYPTLATRLLITPGSWFAWDFNQAWADAVGFWADV